MVAEGELAPDFTLTDDSGDPVTLSDLRGRKVVLYFYPKDDTPGCTTQACGIRDVFAEIDRTGALVFGVSPDDAASHERFRRKYALPFTLLADPDHRVAEAYGVWGERTYMGRRYMGIERTTFVLDERGMVTKVLRKVKPARHADDVLVALAG
jgi:peroxiredoxin Q/BCP